MQCRNSYKVILINLIMSEEKYICPKSMICSYVCSHKGPHKHSELCDLPPGGFSDPAAPCGDRETFCMLKSELLFLINNIKTEELALA